MEKRLESENIQEVVMSAAPKLAEETNTMESREEKDRLTVYLPKSIIKQLKHLAIDVDKDLSQLAEFALVELLKAPNKIKP